MRRAKDAGTLLPQLGVGVLAIVCCAGLPVLASAFAGLTLAAILGLSGGLIALVAARAGVVPPLRARPRDAAQRIRTSHLTSRPPAPAGNMGAP
jgi:hypothetical protein